MMTFSHADLHNRLVSVRAEKVLIAPTRLVFSTQKVLAVPAVQPAAAEYTLPATKPAAAVIGVVPLGTLIRLFVIIGVDDA